MIYDVNHKNWTRGPSLNIRRYSHACMVDPRTETIYVMGGLRESTTESLQWNQANSKWKMGPNLKEELANSAAVSSRSNKFVGYLVGGRISNAIINLENTSKIWGLRKHDMEWIEMSKRLRIPRNSHTLVNVQLGEIGC